MSPVAVVSQLGGHSRSLWKRFIVLFSSSSSSFSSSSSASSASSGLWCFTEALLPPSELQGARSWCSIICGHEEATPPSLRHTSLSYLWAALLTQSMMEQTGEPAHNNNNAAGNELPACGLHSKRLKQLENAALQTTLISQMETESGADAGRGAEQQPGEDEQSNGSSLNHQPAAPAQLRAGTEAEEVDSGETDADERVEETRTLTDHLNKRLLSSFLEKLNERDLALPGVQRLDCAVADEDSNRAAEEW